MSISRVVLVLIGIALMIFGFVGFRNASYASEAGTIIGEAFEATPGTPVPDATSTPELSATSEAEATSVVEPDVTAEATPAPTQQASDGDTAEDSVENGDFVPTLVPPVVIIPPNPNFSYSYIYTAIGSHVVQPGETLFCIGRAYAVHPYAIGAMNSLQENDTLLPGQRLSIPNAPATDIIAGKVCAPQFASPYVPTQTPTPTATATASVTPTPTAIVAEDDVDENNGQDEDGDLDEIAPQLVMTETRKIVVSLPKNMILGESLEVSLTFNPEDLNLPSGSESVPVEATATALPTPDQDQQVSPPSFSDLRYYEDYLLYSIARLDAPGFKISSANEERRLVRVGEEIVYRWSIQPIEAENQTVIVSLWLEYEPMRENMPPVADGMYWNASYAVEVRQTFFGLTTRTLQTTAFLAEGLGLVSLVAGLFPRRKDEDDE